MSKCFYNCEDLYRVIFSSSWPSAPVRLMEDLGTWQYATAAKSSIIQNDIKCVTLAQMKMNKDVQKLWKSMFKLFLKEILKNFT